MTMTAMQMWLSAYPEDEWSVAWDSEEEDERLWDIWLEVQRLVEEYRAFMPSREAFQVAFEPLASPSDLGVVFG